MIIRVPSLYEEKTTLNTLYTEDSTLFAGMIFPEGVDGNNVAGFLLMRYGQLETIFSTAAEAKTAFALWASIKTTDWEKMWDALTESYKPLENYSMEEKMTNEQKVTQYGHTKTRTDNLSHTKTGSDTVTPNLTDALTQNLTDQETPNLTETESNDVYGFNSGSAVHQTSSSSGKSGTNTTAHTGTSSTTHTGTESTQYNTTEADTGTQTDAESGSDTETRNYTLTRSGNIGVTTSQQMLESEMELRCRWNMYSVIADGFYSEFCVKVW